LKTLRAESKNWRKTTNGKVTKSAFNILVPWGAINMRIAISTNGKTMDAVVDPRFGRCQYFIIVDPDTMQFDSVENPSITASGGAGVSTAQTIASKGIEAVLTGNCGPNAYQVLSPAGIKVITGVSGKVRDAVQSYKSGNLEDSTQPNVADHFGMGGIRGMGMGRGRGMNRR